MTNVKRIKTGDDTWREETAADRMLQVLDQVEKENKNKKKKEPLDWKMLLGLKNNLYD